MNQSELRKKREKIWNKKYAVEKWLKENYGGIGCRFCPHFVENNVPGKYIRYYCKKDNFNLDCASYDLKLTTHGKIKMISDYPPDSWEHGIPFRCPLIKEK